MAAQMPAIIINDSPPPSTATAPVVSKFATEDIVQQINGNFGRWQLRTVLLIVLCKIPTAWFFACVIYTAPTPQKGDYFCKPQQQLNISTSSVISDEQSPAPAWIRKTHTIVDERRTDRQFHVDACNIYEEQLERNFAAQFAANYTNPFEQPTSKSSKEMYNYTVTNGGIIYDISDSIDNINKVNVIPCEHFVHNSDYNSLVTQFDLVCSRQMFVAGTQSFHALGAVIGGLLAIKILKHFSPRRLMLIGMLCQIFCGSLTGLVSSFQLHIFFRCLTSVFCALMYTSGQIILSDITGGTAKTIIITLSELFWSIGLILLPGISIFFDSWSYLYVAISCSVIILVFLHRWIADSPRWLLRHNKIDKALQILLESAAFNNRDISLDLITQLEAYAEKLQATPQMNYWSIWDGKTPKKYLITIHWAWVVAVVLYNVMMLLIRSLGVEHIHVNTVCLGFAEMIGVFLGLFFILYTRRRWLWVGYLMLAAGILTYFIWCVPDSIKENRRAGILILFWIILKLANSASLSVLTTCTGELITPEKRPMLMLSVVTFSRIWLLVAPFISIFTVFHMLIPITIFATLALCNGILMCFLSRSFWNDEQPRIQKILTPNTYRRNSTNILLRRSSTCSELSGGSVGNTNPGFYDNQNTISISELWHMDSRFSTINEYDSASEDLDAGGSVKMQETINI